jgi:DNA-binding NarL/FixJ family response regulator
MHACTSKPCDPPYLSNALAQESARLSMIGKSGDPMKTLGKRERQVLLMAASGMTNPEIAASIFIAQKTVENHKSSALKKLGMAIPEFAIWAKENGYLG